MLSIHVERETHLKRLIIIQVIRTITAIVLLLVASLGFGTQNYRPRPGETDLKLDVQNRGSVYIRLFTLEAPKTTAHIIKLVKSGFYDQQRFHRVDKSPKPYLVQIGDPTSKTEDIDGKDMGTHFSGETLPFEDTGHQNIAGAVGLVRDPRDPNSGDSQFYVLLGNQKFLDGNYAVFGQVVSGMDVVEHIEKGDRVTSATIVTG